MTRLERLGETLAESLLVTRGVDVRYLTGFESSNAALLVEPGGATTLYTDFRYAESARAVGDVTFVETKRSVIDALAGLLTGRRIGYDPDHVTVAGLERLTAGGVEAVPVRGAVAALRAVKDAGEIEAIRRAAALSDRVFGELAGERFSGRSERELAWWVERRFRELGAEATSFAPIVAAAANGARPHAHPGPEPIGTGTLVVVDAGCVVDGYCSDCTRTFAVGEPDERLRSLYDLCARAQLDGLAAVRPGAAGRDVDAASRVPIVDAGLADAYGHGLGHGVGLEIHEGPTLRPESDDVLRPGNVVTVEPGLYLAGDVGVRIEDLVVVTDDGCERLTTFTKDMLVVA